MRLHSRWQRIIKGLSMTPSISQEAANRSDIQEFPNVLKIGKPLS
jgi:hypothetical protein